MSNILVTDLKIVDSPQAGIGVAESLKLAGHKIYGADDTPFVTTSNLFEKTFVLEEIRNLNLDSLVQKLALYKEAYDIEYLIPCYDETVTLFSFIKDKLDFLGIKLISPNLDLLKKIRKNNLENILPKNLYTPKTKIVRNINDAKIFAEEIKYPVYVKGLTKAAYRATNEEELVSCINKICNIWNNGEIECIIQKEIVGNFINSLIAYKDNKIIAYVEMEKIGLDSNGATWFGKLTNRKNILTQVKNLCESINLNDCIIEFETIKNKDDDNYYLYEINSRPPAWIYASALNDLNFLEIFINPTRKTYFNEKEVYFGRETTHFLKSMPEFSDYSKLQFFSKGAAYKSNNQKYPSELMLD